jgi:hypothetical protein
MIIRAGWLRLRLNIICILEDLLDNFLSFLLLLLPHFFFEKYLSLFLDLLNDAVLKLLVFVADDLAKLLEDGVHWGGLVHLRLEYNSFEVLNLFYHQALFFFQRNSRHAQVGKHAWPLSPVFIWFHRAV